MVETYKNKFNKKYGFPKDKSHSITSISKLTGYKRSGLQTIYNKGVGAFKTAGPSRPNMTKESWGQSRLYASVNKSSKAYKIDKIHLKKK
jgi:hypothetical protein